MVVELRKFHWDSKGKTLSADSSEIFGKGPIPKTFVVNGVREAQTFRYFKDFRDPDGGIAYDVFQNSEGSIRLILFKN